MNNREWLYSLDVADLADWFAAEHVNATCDNSGENVTHDSREKLEDEILDAGCADEIDYDRIIGWLDRQAAITERECFERAAKSDWLGQHLHAVMAENRELQAKVDELTAERDELQAAYDELAAIAAQLCRACGFSMVDASGEVVG